MLAYADFRDIPSPLRVARYTDADRESGVFTAFPRNAAVTFTVSVDRAFLTGAVSLRFLSDDTGDVTEYEAKRVASSVRGRDAFSVCLPLARLCPAPDGLFYYHVVAETVYGTLYSHGRDGEKDAWFSDDIGYADAYQLTVYRPGYRTPDYLGRGVMYQIFVDRFARGGDETPRADAVMAENWDDEISQYPAYPGAPLANNLFYGGDLDGVRKKLPYLRSLGVTVLYLCPIFEAYSNHKYDTGDYFRVDAMFGGRAALDRLIDACREAGVRLILDGVFNHTGAISRYFNADGRYDSVGAVQSKSSPYYGWYRFSHYPDTYDCWWGVKILPAVNSAKREYIDFISGQSGVIDTYLREGVSGFRLDVADELDESLLRAIRARIRENDPDGAVIGEVWEDASNKIAYGKRRRYFRGEELDSVMNYPLKDAIISYLLNGDAAAFARTTQTLYAHYPRAVSEAMMNLLGTHDTVRILTALGGRDVSGLSYAEMKDDRLSPREKKIAVARLRLAYTILAFMPGIPCVYYGDEAGMQGAKDPFNRRTYPWGNEDAVLLSFYRQIGKFREEYADLLAHGLYRCKVADGDLLVISRAAGNTELRLCVNRGEKTRAYVLPQGARDVFTGHPADETAEIPPCTLRLVRVRKRG